MDFPSDRKAGKKVNLPAFFYNERIYCMECSCCNKASTKIFMNKIKNGYICNGCLDKLPYIFEDKIIKYTSDEIKSIISSCEKASALSMHTFFTTAAYGCLHLDSLHGLISIGEISDYVNDAIEDNKVFVFPIKSLINISFDVNVKKASEEEIKGNVTASLETKDFCIRNIPINKNVYIRSCIVEEGTVTFSLPPEVQLIRSEIIEIANQNEILHSDANQSNAILRAKGLFMVDDNYTISDLKKQRNRLMKVFHPDSDQTDGAEERTKTIAEAYKLLEKNIT